MSGSWHEVAVIVAEPIRLPRFDPHWNTQCLQCVHVFERTREGVRILRCMRAPIVGGGGRLRDDDLRMYCIEVIDEDCKAYGWFQRKDDDR